MLRYYRLKYAGKKILTKEQMFRPDVPINKNEPVPANTSSLKMLYAFLNQEQYSIFRQIRQGEDEL